MEDFLLGPGRPTLLPWVRDGPGCRFNSMYSCGDSNALILPRKAKNRKQKSNFQTRGRLDKKLSKSQQRKVKKLEEEKEQQILLSKSLENLEKYKISDDVYSLLWSSENIGKEETMREKRKRVMQFSKAGLVVPESDMGTKKKKVGSSESDVDASESSPLETADYKDATFKPMLVERASRNCSASSAFSQGPVETLSNSGRTESSVSINEVGTEDCCKVMNLVAGKSLLTQSPEHDNKIVTAVDQDEVKGESRADSYATIPIVADPITRPQITPTVVHVSRPKDVENGRRDLPIIMMEQEIMETINNHSSVIICGETGCGKTTQIPQFLYEAGYGSKKCPMKGGIIGVTQPRRVAVLSTAKRVAYELGVHLGKEVGFQVRHDRRIGENCSIKFMTDGILLRELQSDFFLKRYSVVILDEAHERSLNTDILIGMLSRVIRVRQGTYEAQQRKLLSGEAIRPEMRIYPLKVILMSATLRVEDFTSGSRIFDEPPPVIEIPTRQFPVTTHFSKKTVLTDYIGEAYKMVIKIHKKLPPGGILVFATGQREVEDLCHKLRQASKQYKSGCCDSSTQAETSTATGMGQIDGYSMKEIDEALDTRADSTEDYHNESHDESDNNDECSSLSSESDDELDIGSDYEDLEVDEEAVDFNEDVNLDSLKAAFETLTAPKLECTKKEIDFVSQDVQHFSSPRQKGEKKGPVVGPLHVLPLYAMLPAAAQLRVFEEIKDGNRLVVVATNVAETSLTIPGIRYVVDTGREKVKEYNPSNGIESYEIKWISKASASQRAGRAGRTGPGHCYCLYSSAALCNEFQDFSCAEILKIPVEGVILVLKSMAISKVENFPFPTRPDATALKKAEDCLVALGALDSEGRLTPLGKTMAQYPMSPRHSRLLLVAIQIANKEVDVRSNLVLGYAVAVAAALSSSNPFLFQFDESQTNSEQEDKSGSLSNQKIQDQQAKLMKKEMKKSSKISRKKFSSRNKSDALIVAYALQGFEQSKDPSEFCNENALHLKVMVEMSKLRKQLLQLVFNQKYSGIQQEFSWNHGTIKDVEDVWKACSDQNCLFDKEEDILCEAICAGWADRVAKRIKKFSASSEGVRKGNAIPYQASSVNEPVFLRRWSPVSRLQPDFLVYNEMLRTKRPYIQGATHVEPKWLEKYAGSLCTYSAPLTDPSPFYDPHLDQVLSYVVPYFGPQSWELPRSKVPIKDVKQRIAVFAYALLDGQVLPCLNSAKKYMADLPRNLLKPEEEGQKRVGNLLSKLRIRRIDSCERLKEAWKEDPILLYSEIIDWLQDKYRRQFDILWKKMHKEAFLLPQDRFRKRKKEKKKKT